MRAPRPPEAQSFSPALRGDTTGFAMYRCNHLVLVRLGAIAAVAVIRPIHAPWKHMSRQLAIAGWCDPGPGGQVQQLDSVVAAATRHPETLSDARSRQPRPSPASKNDALHRAQHRP